MPNKIQKLPENTVGKESYDAYMALDSYYRPPIIPTVQKDPDGGHYIQWYQDAEHWLDQTKISDELAAIAIEWGEIKQKENAY